MIRTHPGARNNFSLLPAVGGWLVTVTHGYLNAAWFAEYGRHLRDRRWLNHPCSIMRNLRPCPGGARYCIPHGGLCDYATQAVYFCELWAWFGFALISCGPNGAFIFLVSLANLVPRAVASHSWYLAKFGDEYAALNRK